MEKVWTKIGAVLIAASLAVIPAASVFGAESENYETEALTETASETETFSSESLSIVHDTEEWKEEASVQEIEKGDISADIAASGSCGDGVTWVLDSDGTLTISGQGSIRSNTSPWNISGIPITEIIIKSGVQSIGDSVFSSLYSLKKVTIMRGLVSIGDKAFYRCDNLEKVIIPETTTQIGSHAFHYFFRSVNNPTGSYWPLDYLVIYGSEGSPAETYANEKGIPFQIIQPEDELDFFEDVIYYDGDTKNNVYFKYSLDDCLSSSGTQYNPDLAYLLSAFATSAYNSEGMPFTELDDDSLQDGEFPENPLPITESLKNFGFNAVKGGDVEEWNYYSSPTDPNYKDDIVAFTLATKTMDDGTPIILITIRGSYGAIWEFTPDWKSNASFSNDSIGLHEGFDHAAKDILEKRDAFVREKSIDENNAIYVITGHSRGAAVGNLVAKDIIDSGHSKDKVYGYNFACPDTGKDKDTNWNPNGKYDSIFNINNVRDIAGIIPGCIFSGALNLNPDYLISGSGIVFWGKYGKTRFFSEDWDSVTESMIDKNIGEQHDSKLYMRFMKARPSFDSYKTWLEARAKLLVNAYLEPIRKIGKIFGTFCPVDLAVIDSNGVKVAEVIDGQPQYYSDSFGDVYILNAGDQNLVYLNGRNDYYVRLTGSDTGVMTYIVCDALSMEEQPEGITYTDVSLETGKTMVSKLDSSEEAEEATLVVLNEDSEPEKKIETDGAEVDADEELKEEYAEFTAICSNATYELNKTSIEKLPTGETEKLRLSGSDGSTGKGAWSSSNESIATVDGNGLVTAVRYGKATIHVEMENGFEQDCEVQTRFSDVAGSPVKTDPDYQYYYNAVYWAADYSPKAITKGYDLKYFGVGQNCERQDFILFIYRLAGEPNVSISGLENTFSDVSDLSTSFKKAIAWGYKKGIIKGYTSGKNAGKFGVRFNITRREAMIMLWRFAGKPAPASNDISKVRKFTDVEGKFSASTDTYKAIAWAAGNGITNGYTNQSDIPEEYGYTVPCFGCDMPCLREQMIVFLNRAATK